MSATIQTSDLADGGELACSGTCQASSGVAVAGDVLLQDGEDQDDDGQHEGERGAEPELPERERLLVDLGREGLGRAGRPAAGEGQDLVEDAQPLDDAERRRDGDRRADGGHA